MVTQSTKDYFEQLEKDIDQDRIVHGKEHLKKQKIAETKKIKVSTTNPESGYMVRDGKPKGFFYLDYRTVAGKYNIITDVYVIPGNVNDVDPYIDRLETQIKKFNFNTKYVVADTGYSTNPICKKLSEQCLLTSTIQNMKKIARVLSHLFGGFLNQYLSLFINISGFYKCYRINLKA